MPRDFITHSLAGFFSYVGRKNWALIEFVTLRWPWSNFSETVLMKQTFLTMIVLNPNRLNYSWWRLLALFHIYYYYCKSEGTEVLEQSCTASNCVFQGHCTPMPVLFCSLSCILQHISTEYFMGSSADSLHPECSHLAKPGKRVQLRSPLRPIRGLFWEDLNGWSVGWYVFVKPNR